MKKLAWLFGVLGVLVLFGGLLAHWFGFDTQLPIPRPELVVWGTSIVGIMLIIGSVAPFVGRNQQVEIEEKDERNIAIRKEAGATAFYVMSLLLGAALFLLIFMGYMNQVSAAALIAVYLISYAVYLFGILFLKNKM